MSSSIVQNTPNKIVGSTMKLFYAFGIAQGFIIFVFLFINDFKVEISFNATDILSFIIPSFLFVSIFLGKFLFKKNISEIKKTETLSKKLGSYQTAFIIQAAIAEGVTILAIIIYGQNVNLLFLAVSLVSLLYYLTLKPSKEKIINDLQLNIEERQSLNLGKI